MNNRPCGIDSDTFSLEEPQANLEGAYLDEYLKR